MRLLLLNWKCAVQELSKNIHEEKQFSQKERGTTPHNRTRKKTLKHLHLNHTETVFYDFKAVLVGSVRYKETHRNEAQCIEGTTEGNRKGTHNDAKNIPSTQATNVFVGSELSCTRPMFSSLRMATAYYLACMKSLNR